MNSILRLRRVRRGMQIFLKILTGKTLTLGLERLDDERLEFRMNLVNEN